MFSHKNNENEAFENNNCKPNHVCPNEIYMRHAWEEEKSTYIYVIYPEDGTRSEKAQLLLGLEVLARFLILTSDPVEVRQVHKKKT